MRLYGFHSVVEALKNPRRKVSALYVGENALARLEEMAPGSAPRPTILRPDELSRLVAPGAVHQGIIADVEPLPGLDLEDIPDDGVVLVLDQVTDPHNVGAILRSAAAFGASAMLTTDRHSPHDTGVLAKAASGALEHVPIITVPNLAQALAQLGKRGFWRVGLDSEGEASLEDSVGARPLVLVLGAEGKGLRRLTRERCDVLARLDVPGALRSLNVSNAAAVALYAISRADPVRG
jgi:23S rRNA (guanosine2251-2'-O)-methyltransferase